MTLINLAESWLPYPQFERLFFSDTENAVVINGKEKKKVFKTRKQFLHQKKQGESQEIQGHQNYWKKQDFLSHFLVNKPEWSLKV